MFMRFYSYELDIARRELRRDGALVPIQPRAFDLLVYLAKHRHRLVPKAELMDRFWPANASEAALQKAVSLVRKAMSDDTRDARVIRTQHGRGFRFVAPVVETHVEVQHRHNIPECLVAGVGFLERRFATVLAVRYGQTANASPSSHVILEAFLKECKSVIEAGDGTLLRMIPDGFTAVFGLGLPCEDGPRRATQSALALRAAALAISGSDRLIAPSFGIETGVLDIAIDPSAKPDANRLWTPPGDLERHALSLADIREGIVLGHEARLQLRDEIQVVPGAASKSWVLETVVAFGPGLPARPQETKGDFIGREIERAYLGAALADTLAGKGRAILVTGQAGIGKSRLVAEACDGLDPVTIRQVRLQCLPRLRQSPSAQIQTMCLALFGTVWPVCLEDPIDDALAKLFLKRPVDGKGTALNELSPRELQTRGHRLLIDALEHVSAQHPLLLVFEDVHWIDNSSYAALDEMIRALDGLPVMILMTSRPSDRSAALTEGALSLPRLNDEESLRLFGQTTSATGISEARAVRLVRRAEGNPFFIEEMALAAVSEEDAADSMPLTLQAVIAGRIGSIPPDLRRLVYLFAVIGPPVSPSLAAQLLGQPASVLDRAVAELSRHGIVRREIDGVVFRHMLLHDTAYAMVPEVDRVRLHRQIAEILMQRSQHEIVPLERLAWHWQEAGDAKQSVKYWSLASRAALHRSARSEAIDFADAGLALIAGNSEEDARAELGLLMSRAPALSVLRGFPATEVGEAYRRTWALSRRLKDVKADIRALVGLWIHAWVAGNLEQALDHAKELERLAERAQDPALTLQAHAAVGHVLLHRGRISAAAQALELGMKGLGNALPETVPAQNAAVACACYALWAATLLNGSQSGAEALQRADRLSNYKENSYARAIFSALTAEHYMFTGDVERCLSNADEAIAISEAHDFPFWLGTGLVLRGWSLGQLKETDAGLAVLDRGIDVFSSTGAGVQLANWHGLRAATLLAAGSVTRGKQAIDIALDCARRTQDVFFTPHIHCYASRLSERLCQDGAAETHRRKAKLLIREFGIDPLLPSLLD